MRPVPGSRLITEAGCAGPGSDTCHWYFHLPALSWFYHVAASSDAVYASVGDDSNLYRSTDGGNAWEKLTNFTPVDDGDEVPMQGMAIALDPNDSNHIFFSRSARGMLQTPAPVSPRARMVGGPGRWSTRGWG